MLASKAVAKVTTCLESSERTTSKVVADVATADLTVNSTAGTSVLIVLFKNEANWPRVTEAFGLKFSTPEIPKLRKAWIAARASALAVAKSATITSSDVSS